MAKRVNTRGTVLIVDDEPNAIKVLATILSDDGYEIREAADVKEAVKVLHEDDVDAIITDVKMPGEDGMQFFTYTSEHQPDIPVIFLTAYGTVSSAVTAMENGAFYYFIKPPDYIKLKNILNRAVEQRQLKREVQQLRGRLSRGKKQCDIVGTTPGMQRVMELVDAVKDSQSSVLICGETGTGKELIARALHESSRRSGMPFVAVNCAAIPKNLMEAELFGCEKGAFTGADARRTGKFEEASQGVLFLDEIGELEFSLQAKLLRVLQERQLERLGSNRKIKVDFRLVSSTNRDLRQEVQNANFREDLYYRINVIEVALPPLRERRDDIPLLVSEFVREFCCREGKNLTLSPDVMETFMRYHWPGNIRQLRNVVESAVVLACDDRITLNSLPDDIHAFRESRPGNGALKTFREIETEAVRESLQMSRGNKSKAARLLGISRKALYKRLRRIDQKEGPVIRQGEDGMHERGKKATAI